VAQARRNLALQAERDDGLVYSSPAIFERRRRILEETRKMIIERGVAGFNMDELCKRAGVAKRTLYNAYQTKERMIALAINEHFAQYLANIPLTTPEHTIERHVERMLHVMQRNRDPRNYLRALCGIYFSQDIDADIWASMHASSVTNSMEWILALKAKRQLQPWVDPESLASDVVRAEYAIANDWCRGAIPDDKAGLEYVRAVLLLAIAATRGTARKEIEDLLRKFEETGAPLPSSAPPKKKP
jgi:AcrR family transcriptional regulator